ncbi:hypothetical protein [Streptomyces sp. NBC_01537]|uniref:hypothetical protein n=1 Tax=Streptomyces sp. NBC_01537 TaxID=2903896 RepID=UPI00386D31D4
MPVGAGPQSHYTVQAQPAPGAYHCRCEHKEPLPDPVCTPGALNPKVTLATIGSTICRTGGYTSGIRPSSYVTGKEKAANAKSYGYTGNMRDGEYDHLISLRRAGRGLLEQVPGGRPAYLVCAQGARSVRLATGAAGSSAR